MKLSYIGILISLFTNGLGLNVDRGVFIHGASQILAKGILDYKKPYTFENNKSTEEEKEEKITKQTTDNPLTITFYSDITRQSCVSLTQAIKTMHQQSKELEILYSTRLPIKLHIQSLGGELMPSFYVCDLIKSIDTPIHIYIDGYVASAASLIAVCGNKRYITPHSTMLIHQLKSSSTGKYNEMKDELNNLNFFMNNLKDIYLDNSRIKENELDELLKTDLWLPAKKCLSLGLVDEII